MIRQLGSHACTIGLLTAIATLLIAPTRVSALDPLPPSATARCIGLELYVKRGNPADSSAREQVERFIADHQGIQVQYFEVENGNPVERRLAHISGYFKVEPRTPSLYGCGRLIVAPDNPAQWKHELQSLITLTVYVRSGCQRCAKAKEYFPLVQSRFPGFRLQLHDVATDTQASRDLQDLIRRYQVAAASVPVFHVCNQVLVGFDDATTTGKRLEEMLNRWTVECSKQAVGKSSTVMDKAQYSVDTVPTRKTMAPSPSDTRRAFLAQVNEANPEPALPLPDEPAPPSLNEHSSGNGQHAPTAPDDAIDLPLFGRVQVRSWGLPWFTVAVGLVDGFNPCAMWVLLFLLSVLVNLHSRGKILAVAGTFIVISGAAYFAFMAAWLNVFQWLGMLAWIRVTLALMAIGIGLVHTKDFFAFKQGLSLSIPESAKPGIYDRVRRIVTAENLAGAVIGAAALAVLVNMIELLCTAGLPALYTKILSSHKLSLWGNYAYLLLYNAAYMFDDILMVTLVVVTLKRRKLQETHGRWLKLISGVAILALGLLMLVRPDWLGMEP